MVLFMASHSPKLQAIAILVHHIAFQLKSKVAIAFWWPLSIFT